MLPKDKYERTIRRPYPPFYASLLLNGMCTPRFYRPFLGADFAFREEIKLGPYWYHSIPDLYRGAALVLKRWRSRQQFEKAKILLCSGEQKLMAAAKQDLQKFSEQYEKYVPAITLVWIVEHGKRTLFDVVFKALKQKTSEKEAEYLMDVLNNPLMDNLHKIEERDLIGAKSLSRHVKKYKFFVSRYGEDIDYTVADARKKLRGIDKTKFLRENSLQKSELRKAIKRAKDLLGKKDSILIDILQFCVYYRTQRTDVINKAQYLYIPMLKKIAKKHGLTYEQILHCTKDEIISKKLPPKNVINERIKNHALIFEKGRMRILDSQEIKKLTYHLTHSEVNVKKTVKGSIGYRGLVKGTVRVVFGRHEFNKIKSGNILVTSMTTPNMIPIMKKAAAFVTDEGGVTCHAAVFSREMKKPCVIGTKTATKVFKDGDMVEVDANKGVVRKI